MTAHSNLCRFSKLIFSSLEVITIKTSLYKNLLFLQIGVLIRAGDGILQTSILKDSLGLAANSCPLGVCRFPRKVKKLTKNIFPHHWRISAKCLAAWSKQLAYEKMNSHWTRIHYYSKRCSTKLQLWQIRTLHRDEKLIFLIGNPDIFSLLIFFSVTSTQN